MARAPLNGGKEFLMNRAFLAGLLGATLLFAGACKSKPSDKDAIRSGVINYLTSLKTLNVNAMDVDRHAGQRERQSGAGAGGNPAEKWSAGWREHEAFLQSGKARRRMGRGEEPTGRRHDAASRARRNATGRIATRAPEREWCGGTSSGGASGFQWDLEVGAASGTAGAGGGSIVVFIWNE